MNPYACVFIRGNSTYVSCIFGKDRDDVISFIKTHYRKVLGKIVSVKQIRGGGNA